MSAQCEPEALRLLKAELGRPTREETCFRPPGDADRLGALRRLAEIVPPPAQRRGVNLHVHTGKSFSLFYSPAAACWRAYQEGIEFFGINDHYTVAGFDEFRQACRILGIKPTFSMEAIAMDSAARERGELLNDPDNPGRTYFTAKGVTRPLPPGGEHARAFDRVLQALARRHERMTALVSDWLRNATAGRSGLLPIPGLNWECDIPGSFLPIPGLDWERDVLGRTPHGNVTERHIAGAIADALAAAPDVLMAACAEWFGAPPDSLDPAPFQGYLRKFLLKSGRPCYVEESAEAYLSLTQMRDIFLAMGAIPTYPILGNPVTHVERDVDALLDFLADIRVIAVEVIPYRNTRERLREIVNACKKRCVPVFTGTEHNSLDDKPLVDPLSADPEFIPYFEASARTLLGHHEAAKRGDPGFVGPDGLPAIRDPQERFARFEEIGSRV